MAVFFSGNLAMTNETNEIKLASRAALFSILNLTLLPVVGFLALLWMLKKTAAHSVSRYHVDLGIKLNIIAALALFLVCGLMIYFGGFNSPWTWVYVISYFTLVHTFFIVLAVWALVRAWSGDRLKK